MSSRGARPALVACLVLGACGTPPRDASPLVDAASDVAPVDCPVDAGAGVERVARTPTSTPAPIAADATDVLWLESDGAGGTDLRAASKPCGATRTLASVATSLPVAVVVDASAVYFVTIHKLGAYATLWSVPRAGGAPTSLLDTISFPSGLAQDDSYLYIAESTSSSPIASTSSVIAVPKAGGAPRTVDASYHGALSLALASGVLYVGVGPPDSSLVRVGVDGSGRAVVATGVTPTALVVAGASVVWIDGFGATSAIRSVATGGGAVTTLAPLENDAQSLATDQTSVFWTRSGVGSDPPGELVRAGVAGTSSPAVLASGLGEPVGAFPASAATDDQYIYLWSVTDAPGVVRARK